MSQCELMRILSSSDADVEAVRTLAARWNDPTMHHHPSGRACGALATACCWQTGPSGLAIVTAILSAMTPAEVNAYDEHGVTALHCACEFQRSAKHGPAVVAALLEQMTPATLSAQEHRKDRTALSVACVYQQGETCLSIVRMLLAHMVPEAIDSADIRRNTALHLACITRAESTIISALIATMSPAAVRAGNDAGATALSLLCTMGDWTRPEPTVVALLLDKMSTTSSIDQSLCWMFHIETDAQRAFAWMVMCTRLEAAQHHPVPAHVWERIMDLGFSWTATGFDALVWAMTHPAWLAWWAVRHAPPVAQFVPSLHDDGEERTMETLARCVISPDIKATVTGQYVKSWRTAWRAEVHRRLRCLQSSALRLHRPFSVPVVWVAVAARVADVDMTHLPTVDVLLELMTTGGTAEAIIETSVT